jgi:hypothetical protein
LLPLVLTPALPPFTLLPAVPTVYGTASSSPLAEHATAAPETAAAPTKSRTQSVVLDCMIHAI